MEETIVSIETALLLRDKGFYNTNCSGVVVAPTQSLAQKWLRDVHGVFLTIECDSDGGFRYHGYNLDAYNLKYPIYLGIDDTELFEFGSDKYEFDTYEEALEKGLIESLNLIK